MNYLKNKACKEKYEIIENLKEAVHKMFDRYTVDRRSIRKVTCLVLEKINK